MVAMLEHPPSVRDFDVFRRIVVYGLSTRQVAQEHHLSQTRVRQIADRVAHWIAKLLPHFDIAEEHGLRLARQLASERLDFFYGQAMHGWNVANNPRCLALALRITMAQVRLPCIPGRLEALAADVTEGPLPDYLDPQACIAAFQELEDEQERQLAQAASRNTPEEHPPIADCSPPNENGEAAMETAAAESTTTPPAANTSEKISLRDAAARRAFFAPAHREFEREMEPLGGSDSGALREEHPLDLDVEEALRRHQRRRRRRDRRLAKAK